MEQGHATSPDQLPIFDTDELQQWFLIEEVFLPGGLHAIEVAACPPATRGPINLAPGWVPRDPYEKIADAGQFHQCTGIARQPRWTSRGTRLRITTPSRGIRRRTAPSSEPSTPTSFRTTSRLLSP